MVTKIDYVALFKPLEIILTDKTMSEKEKNDMLLKIVTEVLKRADKEE
ncbi:MAG: hypothetical protein FWG90_04820 [Oscillospiraceae bacterium]|nr:hypothetical protein [Oscillospiraceae bacterium]